MHRFGYLLITRRKENYMTMIIINLQPILETILGAKIAPKCDQEKDHDTVPDTAIRKNKREV